MFVGGISYDTDEDQLREEFAKFGVVESATVIRDRYSGRSRGFGFVEMASETEAEEAIRGLNGAQFGGRKITVNYAVDRVERGGMGGRGRGYSGERRY